MHHGLKLTRLYFCGLWGLRQSILFRLSQLCRFDLYIEVWIPREVEEEFFKKYPLTRREANFSTGTRKNARTMD